MSPQHPPPAHARPPSRRSSSPALSLAPTQGWRQLLTPQVAHVPMYYVHQSRARIPILLSCNRRPLSNASGIPTSTCDAGSPAQTRPYKTPPSLALPPSSRAGVSSPCTQTIASIPEAHHHHSTFSSRVTQPHSGTDHRHDDAPCETPKRKKRCGLHHTTTPPFARTT